MSRTPHLGSRRESGFALLVVLWVVAIASLVGLTLAAAARSEVRVAIAEREVLTAELLAESGLEFADFLSRRGLGTASENLSEVPATAVVPGLRYQIDVPEGQIGIYLEGEDGKINLSTAPLAVLERFFAGWTEDPSRGARIAAAIGDWRDSDDQPRLGGAEAFAYTGLGYAPRNGPIGAADPLLLMGLGRADFLDRVTGDATALRVTPGLDMFVTTEPGGPGVHPNFAPRRVLLSIPGMTEAAADAIIAARERRFFRDWNTLTQAAGLAAAPFADFMKFGAPTSPAVLAIGRSGSAVRTIRRMHRTTLETDFFTLAIVNRVVPAQTTRDVLPEFAAP